MHYFRPIVLVVPLVPWALSALRASLVLTAPLALQGQPDQPEPREVAAGLPVPQGRWGRREYRGKTVWPVPQALRAQLVLQEAVAGQLAQRDRWDYRVIKEYREQVLRVLPALPGRTAQQETQARWVALVQQAQLARQALLAVRWVPQDQRERVY
jgi:hypothetical protein